MAGQMSTGLLYCIYLYDPFWIFHSFYKYFLIQVESCDKWLLLVDTGIWAAIDIVSSADRILRGTDLEHCTWIDDISLLTSDRSGRLLLRSSIDDLAVVIILSATVSLSSCTWSVILSRTPEIFWNVKIGILVNNRSCNTNPQNQQNNCCI